MLPTFFRGVGSFYSCISCSSSMVWFLPNSQLESLRPKYFLRIHDMTSPRRSGRSARPPKAVQHSEDPRGSSWSRTHPSGGLGRVAGSIPGLRRSTVAAGLGNYDSPTPETLTWRCACDRNGDRPLHPRDRFTEEAESPDARRLAR